MATPELSRSAKRYMERRSPGLQGTFRKPNAHLNLTANAIHSLEMDPPYPLVDVLHCQNNQPPDSGGTKPWPHGIAE